MNAHTIVILGLPIPNLLVGCEPRLAIQLNMPHCQMDSVLGSKSLAPLLGNPHLRFKYYQLFSLC